MSQRQCPRCNAPIRGNPAFCKNCGRKLDDIPPAPPSRWPRWAPFTLGAALLAAALLAALVVLPGNRVVALPPAPTATAAAEALAAAAADTTTAPATAAVDTATPLARSAAPAATTAAPAATAAQTASPTLAMTTAATTASGTGATRLMQGVRAELGYTGRITTDSDRIVTRMRAQPDVNSERRGQLTNGDEVQLLRQDVDGWYQVRVLRSAIDSSVNEEGWIERWLVDGQPIPPTPTSPPPTPTSPPAPPTPVRQLRVRLLNYNDSPNCISMRVTGISVAGWSLSVDGLNLRGTFDGGGNARVCGLASHQEVTISVLNGGQALRGGGGIPAKGSAILQGEWR